MRIHIASRFWQNMSLAAVATLALSLSPALFAQDTSQNPQPPVSANPGPAPASVNPSPVAGEGGVDRHELKNFDDFMSAHPDIAEQVRKDPSLLSNKQFVESNPALKDFYNTHQGVEDQARHNPSGFLKNAANWHERVADQRQAATKSFGNYLNQNPEVRQELEKDPSLASNSNYLSTHPELKNYLDNHPGVREGLKNHPRAVFQREQRYANREHHASVRGGRGHGL